MISSITQIENLMMKIEFDIWFRNQIFIKTSSIGNSRSPRHSSWAQAT